MGKLDSIDSASDIHLYFGIKGDLGEDRFVTQGINDRA
ncbi:hypothetical protein MNB_SUP05-11-20 [hydrothermal vent metagenome]|uniref:Uncharacterized protein n=1 Tax=hydrothermal vent metagenome TaxID=652676 RepID=A0A1W1DE21_9ZZZZ